MTRKKAKFITGTFSHRRTETDYMRVSLDAVSLDDWRAVVNATVAAAKAGDPGARAWLAQYLVGRPTTTAPAPLTVVVQQLSGRDPLIDELAEPHLDRLEYPALHTRDDSKHALKAHVAEELRALEAPEPNVPKTEGTPDK